MTTAVVSLDATLDTLFYAHLLCEVCQMRPWTTTGAYHRALLCPGCLAGEPDDYPEDCASQKEAL